MRICVCLRSQATRKCYIVSVLVQLDTHLDYQQYHSQLIQRPTLAQLTVIHNNARHFKIMGLSRIELYKFVTPTLQTINTILSIISVLQLKYFFKAKLPKNSRNEDKKSLTLQYYLFLVKLSEQSKSHYLFISNKYIDGSTEDEQVSKYYFIY